MRHVGQIRRDAVVDEEPHRHGAEHFLCEPGRLRYDEKQRAADRRVGVARTAGQGVADAVRDGRIDFTPGPARIGEPDAAPVRDNGEAGLELLPVVVRHHVHFRRVGCERHLGDVRAEHRQTGDQPRLSCGRLGARFDQTFECRLRGVHVLGRPHQRSRHRHSRRHGQRRAEGHRDQQPHAERETRFETAMPGDNGRWGGRAHGRCVSISRRSE